MAVIAASIIAYCICLFLFRKNMIVQQLMFFLVYIVSVTYLQSLDVALPIYFVFSLIPFVSGVRIIDRWTFILICALGVYLIYGMLFQNTQRAIIMFVSRCWQFLFFFIVINSKKIIKEDLNFALIIKIAFIVETVLAAYIFVSKRGLYDVIRLTAGAQPITGNTSVVILPILVFLFYMRNRTPKAQTRILIMAFLFALWVALSGTRGYEFVFVITLVWLIRDYITTSSNIKNSLYRFLFFILLTVLLIGILFVLPEYLEKILAVLRLNKTSIGIRTYENAAAVEFMLNAPIPVKLFGVGIGGHLGSYPEFQEAISKQFALGMWNRSHYLNDSGSLFHSLYMNIMCNMGLVGLIVLVISVIKILQTISASTNDKKLSFVMKMFFLGILFMNNFRWSTDCGIAIMGIFALILKVLNQRKQLELEAEIDVQEDINSDLENKIEQVSE